MHFDRPPYDVVAVFDPDGGEPSFAYTHGVFEAYGLPELFVWAVPDDGVDPGEDWQLSTTDQHGQLTDAVQRMLAGEVSSWEHLLDGGRTVLRTTLEPADDDLPTYELSSGTPVRRLRLELVRPPVGSPSRLTKQARTALVRRTQRWADVLLGREVEVRTALGQRYGPGTTGVGLLLDLLTSGDEDLLVTIACMEVASQGGTRSAFAELDAVARTAGRAPWVARAKADVDARLRAAGRRLPADEREVLDTHVGTAFRCAATAWVVADLVDDELFRRATASVRAGRTRCGAPEDDQPAPPERMTPAVQLAADLASGRVRMLTDDEESLDGLWAVWLMAWTGRGQAVMSAAEDAGAEELLEDDRVWELLAAALVVDVMPDVVRLLPPQYRAA